VPGKTTVNLTNFFAELRAAEYVCSRLSVRDARVTARQWSASEKRCYMAKIFSEVAETSTRVVYAPRITASPQ
jgi:hypothetical protein